MAFSLQSVWDPNFGSTKLWTVKVHCDPISCSVPAITIDHIGILGIELKLAGNGRSCGGISLKTHEFGKTARFGFGCKLVAVQYGVLDCIICFVWCIKVLIYTTAMYKSHSVTILQFYLYITTIITTILSIYDIQLLSLNPHFTFLI